MNVLLDTCALLALAGGELPEGAAGALRKAPEAYVSAVSAWEVAIKVAGGKLRLLEPPDRWFLGLVERYGLREVPVDARVACAAGRTAAPPPGSCRPRDRGTRTGARLDRLDVGRRHPTVSWRHDDLVSRDVHSVIPARPWRTGFGTM